MSLSESEMSDWASEYEETPLQRPNFKSVADEKEWERKQRNREYRVSARREKRNRKADEKKQRKLNAVILRRMTKNPDKYNKNVSRNRQREVEMERRKIWREAVAQAERLAAVHDPTGKTFNVGQVVVQEDGKVISVEALERRAKNQAEKAAKLAQADGEKTNGHSSENIVAEFGTVHHDDVNPARQQLIQTTTATLSKTKHLSKTQQRKLAMYEPQPPPPKPVIPDGINLPDGEPDWLSWWDLSDADLERRVMREKRNKAAERKALRVKQKEGKVERRAARDERRKVYREKKLEWKEIKAEEKVQKRRLLRLEQEEAKKIEVEVNLDERRRAMEVCATLGFTLENVEGVDEIQPRALGMRGKEVDFDILEIGDKPSKLKMKGVEIAPPPKNKTIKSNRVDLGKAADESKVHMFNSGDGLPSGLDGDFVSVGGYKGATEYPMDEPGDLNFNHKLRRKLHRAIEAAQIKKELLVRAKAKEYCESSGIEVPVELVEAYKPIKLSSSRILEDGTLETEKQVRVRKRLELAEYNKAAKVLRAQAKAEAIEAGLRVFAALTGQKAIESSDIQPVGDTKNAISTEIVQSGEPLKKRKRDTADPEVKSSKKSKSPTDDIENTNNSVDIKIKTEISSKAKTPNLPNAEHIVSTLAQDEPEITNNKRKAQDENTNEDEADRKEWKRLRKERKAQERLKMTTPEMKNGGVTDTGNSTARSKRSRSYDQEHPLARLDDTKQNQQDNHASNRESTGKEEAETNGAERWNVEALNGTSVRKDKFLRLLGANKVNGDAESSKEKKKLKSSKTSLDITTVEDELERQYEAGVRMKYEGQGKRRGLGA